MFDGYENDVKPMQWPSPLPLLNTTELVEDCEPKFKDSVSATTTIIKSHNEGTSFGGKEDSCR